MIKTYYLLTKPGIIMGNAFTTASAFVFASGGYFDAWLFLATVGGLFFIIGSACVFNNCIDREADALMTRTKNRPLVKGLVSPQSAKVFAVVLGVIGIIVLGLFTNLLAMGMAAIGFFIYVVLYSFWKYHTTFATAVGSIAGAIPPVVGYCAASNRFDMGAALLFMILVLWQMPHFFSIAIFRADEYAAASIPVLPLVKGIYATKVRMIMYVVGFILVAIQPTLFGLTGYAYMSVAVLLGMGWLVQCIRGFRASHDKRWARKCFVVSLVVIMGLFTGLSIDVFTR